MMLVTMFIVLCPCVQSFYIYLQNSIRHSLSKKLNFIKVNCTNSTRGKRASYWAIAPKRLALLQAEVRRAKIRMCDPSILSEISSCKTVLFVFV